MFRSTIDCGGEKHQHAIMVAPSSDGSRKLLLLRDADRRKRRIEKLRRIQHDHCMRLIVIALIGKREILM